MLSKSHDFGNIYQRMKTKRKTMQNMSVTNGANIFEIVPDLSPLPNTAALDRQSVVNYSF